MRQGVVVLVLFLAAPVVSSAQVAEVTVIGGWSAFTNSDVGFLGIDAISGDQVTLDDGIRIGGRFSINRWFLGHEISYTWQRSTLNIAGNNTSENSGMSIQNFYYNFVAHITSQGTSIRPFVTAGLGVSTFFPPGVSSFSGSGDNKYGYNYGVGIKARLTEKFGLRVDVRDHVTSRPFERFGVQTASGQFHNIEYSMGFALLF